ncbi:hypothetical protein IVB30_10625 [Bradyrhizobium sp. 200]|uniref:hypothetical protein n=1 Tax=Bradyrhizobium sp. 200 TaxID=2782665 RepID=UPI001FFE631C|nr:hypothetical protein [Bradyrhizobium sp. 200]UPJ51753.1 hypothetical protein IVB30_10625 [Bradyrhizobium sp. 200]
MPDPDRRSVGRTRNNAGALLFFKSQHGVRGCNVTDLTDRGAKIRTHDLPVLPTTFEITFDNFHTVRRCRLVWREGDFIGVAFEGWYAAAEINSSNEALRRQRTPAPLASSEDAKGT